MKYIKIIINVLVNIHCLSKTVFKITHFLLQLAANTNTSRHNISSSLFPLISENRDEHILCQLGLGVCEKNTCRPAFKSAQSDQHI